SQLQGADQFGAGTEFGGLDDKAGSRLWHRCSSNGGLHGVKEHLTRCSQRSANDDGLRIEHVAHDGDTAAHSLTHVVQSAQAGPLTCCGTVENFLEVGAVAKGGA